MPASVRSRHIPLYSPHLEPHARHAALLLLTPPHPTLPSGMPDMGGGFPGGAPDMGGDADGGAPPPAEADEGPKIEEID